MCELSSLKGQCELQTPALLATGAHTHFGWTQQPHHIKTESLYFSIQTDIAMVPLKVLS